MACEYKWRVFKEKIPASMRPQWVVWDECGEFLFQTGDEALKFVHTELMRRSLSSRVKVDDQ